MAKSRRASQAGAAPPGANADLPPDPPSTKLSEQHESFARHYARYTDATLAYAYAHPGCDKTVCAGNGARLLLNPEIAALVKILLAQDAKNLNFQRHDYLRVLTEIANDPGSKQRREAANDLCNALGLLKDRDDRGGGEADHRRVLTEAQQLIGSRKVG